jgi:alpha-tubulin suppressor-like RCC1 family protein
MNNSGNLVAIGAPNEISGGFVYIYNGNSYQNQNWSYTDKIFQGENYVYYNYEYYDNVCSNLTGVEKISHGAQHYVVLLKNGRLGADGSSLLSVPAYSYTGIVDISAGYDYTLTLDKAGRVDGFGVNSNGILNIPTGIQGNVIQGNVAKISASKRSYNYLVLLKNGFLFATGGVANIFPQSIQGNVTGIYAGYNSSTVLLKDGTLTGWEGWDDSLNCPPSIQGNIKKFNTVYYYSGVPTIAVPYIVALLNDGRVTGWGANGYFDTMKSWNEPYKQGGGGDRISTKYAENIADISSDGTNYFFTLSKDGSITGWFDSGNISYNPIYEEQKNIFTGISDGLFNIDSYLYDYGFGILKNNNTITGFNMRNKWQLFGSERPILSECVSVLKTGRGVSGVIGNSPDTYFGYSVDLNSGNVIAVGAPGYNDNKGSCHIYNLNIGNITKAATLSGSINSGFFGKSVALNSSGNVLIASSPFADISGNGVVVKAAGLSSAFINKSGWELYNTRSNFLNYEYLGTSVAINDTGNVIVLGAIGTAASNGNVNAGSYYISVREQTCPNVRLLDENPVENYTIPNIKVQLDAMDAYSLNQDQPSITYWKNKVNFGKGYNNLYNDGDAITFNSDIELIDIEDRQFSGLLDYNNPRSGDYISFDNKKFVYPTDFSGITGLNNLINDNSLSINKINSKIINDRTLLLSTSGSNSNKEAGQRSLIKTNYLSGSNQGVVLASYYSIFPSQYLNFTKIANDVQNIYACRHSETGEIDSSYRRQNNFIDFNLENEYFLAILKNGKITGFGTNYFGRLLGTTQSIGWNDSPVGKITGAVKLSLGSDFALALLNNRRITGWGNNFSGKATLGNNLTGVIDISAGGNHSLALLADGKVTGWGDNTYGQAFDGNVLSGISGISAGWLHSLALNNSGTITGWGYNEFGQATSGNSLTGVKEISAGKFHSIAILNSGNRITGWGDDYFNQITDIHKIIYSYQVKFSGISQTTNNGYDIFLLNNSGIVTGLGNFSYYEQLQGIALTGITQISNSQNHVMMVNNISKITGFGNNSYYQISSGLNLTGVSQVGAGTIFSIALLKNKKVTGWGDNTDNQAFGGNDLTGVKAISVGWYHNLAILNDNTITGWGNDIYGQAQNGNELTGVKRISAGAFHSLALLNDDTITGWGSNFNGEALNGNSLTGVVDISAGYYYSLALLANGKVTGWGENNFGQALGGNNLTGVLKISAGLYNSTAILNDKNSVTGWGNIDTLTDLFNITSTRSLGPTGFSGISAGLFSSYAYSGDNKKIFNFGQQWLDINLLPKINSTVTQLQQLPKYNFAQGVNFAAFIIENQNSGSMNISKTNINFKFTQSGYNNVLPLEPYSFDTLKSGKYSYSLTGSGFYNVLENYPDNDDFLPKYQTAVMLSSYFTNMSRMIITGYTGSLPISLFFVEYGLLNSDQKTIQSYKNTGCYISTLNTGKLINLTGIGNPIKVNEPFYSDIQIGNLIMDTGRFEYYINNTLIYTGSTGFNFGQILLGNNYQYTGVQPISTYDTYPANLQATDLTGIQKGFNGNLFEILIYDRALNELNRNEVFYYLTNKWQSISNYYPSTTVDLTNRIIYNEKTKTNCSDCSQLLNSLPKQNEPHILLFEYNLYGYSGTMIQDCDLDMQVYILKTGFYEESRKEPLVSNLDVAYISGFEKSISTINARSQNIYNVADFNFGYNKILPSQDRLKTLKSTLELQQPIRNYTTGEYLKYPKIDGNGI